MDDFHHLTIILQLDVPDCDLFKSLFVASQ